MSREGPPLEPLLRRLAECPAAFLAAPRIVTGAGVHVDAVVRDVLEDLGGPPPGAEALAPFRGAGAQDLPRLRLTLVVAWLLDDPALRGVPGEAGKALEFLTGHVALLAEVVPAERFVADADRREDLVRATLDALGLRPAGETEAQATDRRAAVDTLARLGVLRDARARAARAQEIREAMKRREAEESAPRWGAE